MVARTSPGLGRPTVRRAARSHRVPVACDAARMVDGSGGSDGSCGNTGVDGMARRLFSITDLPLLQGVGAGWRKSPTRCSRRDLFVPRGRCRPGRTRFRRTESLERRARLGRVDVRMAAVVEHCFKEKLDAVSVPLRHLARSRERCLPARQTWSPVESPKQSCMLRLARERLRPAPAISVTPTRSGHSRAAYKRS
jgi:hypothetical protein